MDVYLHIGSGKTGTSSIQNLLSVNRDRLAARGYLYPRSPGNQRHTRLGFYAMNDATLDRMPKWHRLGRPDPAGFRAQVATELRTELGASTADRVILSDEALFGLRPSELRRLRDLLADVADNVHLVVYVRRQDDHLISRYQQVVKTGEIRTLPQYVDRETSSTYDYLPRLDTWARVIEPASFTVRRFERSGFAGGSLYTDFLRAVGLDLDIADLEVPAGINRSLDADAVKFLRLWNLKQIECHGATPRRIDNRRHVEMLTEIATGPVLTLPERRLDAFMAQWEPANAEVARRYLGADDAVLFREPRRTANATDDQTLSVEARERILEHLKILPRGRRQLRAIHEREEAAR